MKKNVKDTRSSLKRISMSLPSNLLDQFDKSMKNAGFADRSKAIQASLYEFIHSNEWKQEKNDNDYGAGALVILYDNHIFGNDVGSIENQHEYTDIIVSTTHLHLDHQNCLETIMLKGKINRIKKFNKFISESRGIKSLKMHYIGMPN
ncbi:MAG TPA: CopG family ribbon-helix-helix protein [Nitrososphaeraceae archaeon]|nr:CopG family ribbon-helix-helix protein [Nitrososphaeraceae archaeon]